MSLHVIFPHFTIFEDIKVLKIIFRCLCITEFPCLFIPSVNIVRHCELTQEGVPLSLCFNIIMVLCLSMFFTCERVTILIRRCVIAAVLIQETAFNNFSTKHL